MCIGPMVALKFNLLERAAAACFRKTLQTSSSGCATSRSWRSAITSSTCRPAGALFASSFWVEAFGWLLRCLDRNWPARTFSGEG